MELIGLGVDDSIQKFFKKGIKKDLKKRKKFKVK